LRDERVLYMTALKPGRVYDRLDRAAPRNPFAGKAGTVLLLRLPGFAAQFRRVVPAEFVVRVLASGEAVACPCGEVVPLARAEVAECPGGCSRWFLHAEGSVRVARWPREEGS
jgi:hypothetical protein